ncbi:MAG: hypothetical protein U0798_01855 [Gemmataceae bacterium]
MRPKISIWFSARSAVLLLPLWALCFLGCSSNGPAFHPVKGTVTFKDGTPIKYGQIVFYPDPSRGNSSREICQGTIREGEYVLRTGTREGVPPGAYRVGIEAAVGADEKNPYYRKLATHERYINPDRSALTAEVIDRPEQGRYNFQLDPNPKLPRR